MAKIFCFDLQNLSSFAIHAPFATHPVLSLGLAGEGRDKNVVALVVEIVDMALNKSSKLGWDHGEMLHVSCSKAWFNVFRG
jgi:hypothetical protein